MKEGFETIYVMLEWCSMQAIFFPRHPQLSVFQTDFLHDLFSFWDNLYLEGLVLLTQVLAKGIGEL